MRKLITYGLSTLMLVIFLVNSFGFVLKHLDCSTCESEGCQSSVSETLHYHTCKDDFCTDSEVKDCVHIESCNLNDFSNQEHQTSSCSCFAEYFQLPVFQSEVKNYKVTFEQSLFIAILLIQNYYTPELTRDQIIKYNAPPDKHYQNIPINLINCTFLC